jgi:hypothetical protein
MLVKRNVCNPKILKRLPTLLVSNLVWLRGVDLNHRPLGYEFKGKLILNNLQAHG